MGVKGVLKNIRRQGVGKTIKLARERRRERQEDERITKEIACIQRRTSLEMESRENEDEKAEMAILAASCSDLYALNDIRPVTLTALRNYLGEMASLVAKRSNEDDFDETFELFQVQLDGYYQLFDSFSFGKKPQEEEVLFFEQLTESETGPYKTRLRELFVKQRIPQAYRESSTAPLQNKAVFVQPRKGLNQTFKYMYHYLKSHDGLEPELWQLRREAIPDSFYFRNAEAMAAQAGMAKVAFFHESNDLFGHVQVRDDSKIVQLWHGCGVFKKIGLDTAGQPGYKSVKAYEEYPEYNYYSCVTIASPELSWVFEQFMGISKESGIIKPLGVSRTDEFFDQAYIDRCYEKLYERIPEARDKKVILYAPTYRGLGRNRVAPDELDIPAMAERLGDTHILLIKQHQTAKDCPPVPEPYDQSFAWDVTRGWGMDINELMTIADVCVSDYSSLVFEYSIFERPMAFFVYDLDEYIDDRGLYYDFDEITPGPLCFTTNELIEYIEGIERNGFDPAEVAAFKERFMCSCDGHSTERILEYIENGD